MECTAQPLQILRRLLLYSIMSAIRSELAITVLLALKYASVFAKYVVLIDEPQIRSKSLSIKRSETIPSTYTTARYGMTNSIGIRSPVGIQAKPNKANTIREIQHMAPTPITINSTNRLVVFNGYKLINSNNCQKKTYSHTNIMIMLHRVSICF